MALNLYYTHARYYDPSLGRFLQKDPEPGRLSLPVTVVNSYAYAGNSPLRLTDPSGRSFLGDLILGVLITAAAVFTAGVAAGFMVKLLGAAGTAFAPVIGTVSGAISGGIAGGIVGAVGYGVQGRSAAEGFVAGMIQGAIAGAIAGAIVGANAKAPGGNNNPTKQPERGISSSGEELNVGSETTSSGDGSATTPRGMKVYDLPAGPNPATSNGKFLEILIKSLICAFKGGNIIRNFTPGPAVGPSDYLFPEQWEVISNAAEVCRKSIAESVN